MALMIQIKEEIMVISQKFSSGFNAGKILFHLNDGSSFSYDLFDTGTGQAESFLKIYNDNKTVETEKFHLDVEISYKDES